MARQLLYVANGRALMRERVFRDRSNPLETHDDKAMHKYYRFTRQGIMNIIDLLEPHLQPSTTRSHAIDGRLQIFIALNYYATSDFYSSVRKEHGISISSVCRIVHRVSEVLVELKDEILTFGEKEQKQNEFFALSRFPRVVGAVDGTHFCASPPAALISSSHDSFFTLYLLCIPIAPDPNNFTLFSLM